jgi:hypothetical protein
MRFSIVLFAFILATGCRDASSIGTPTKKEAVEKVSSRFPAILAPLIDPAKLDTLKGKRAATPRLRKACYWLEMARRDGSDLKSLISEAHAAHPQPAEEREGRAEATRPGEKVAPSRTSQR